MESVSSIASPASLSFASTASLRESVPFKKSAEKHSLQGCCFTKYQIRSLFLHFEKLAEQKTVDDLRLAFWERTVE